MPGEFRHIHYLHYLVHEHLETQLSQISGSRIIIRVLGNIS